MKIRFLCSRLDSTRPWLRLNLHSFPDEEQTFIHSFTTREGLPSHTHTCISILRWLLWEKVRESKSKFKHDMTWRSKRLTRLIGPPTWDEWVLYPLIDQRCYCVLCVDHSFISRFCLWCRISWRSLLLFTQLSLSFSPTSHAISLACCSYSPISVLGVNQASSTEIVSPFSLVM